MKKLFKTFLFLFVLNTVFANIVSAQNWIDTIWIHVKTNSNIVNGSSTKIDNNGKFTLEFPKGGNYDITMSYSEIEKALSSMNVKISDVEISLTLYSKSTNAMDSISVKTVVNKETGVLTITVPPGGTVISGTLSYMGKWDTGMGRPNDKHKTLREDGTRPIIRGPIIWHPK